MSCCFCCRVYSRFAVGGTLINSLLWNVLAPSDVLIVLFALNLITFIYVASELSIICAALPLLLLGGYTCSSTRNKTDSVVAPFNDSFWLWILTCCWNWFDYKLLKQSLQSSTCKFAIIIVNNLCRLWISYKPIVWKLLVSICACLVIYLLILYLCTIYSITSDEGDKNLPSCFHFISSGLFSVLIYIFNSFIYISSFNFLLSPTKSLLVLRRSEKQSNIHSFLRQYNVGTYQILPDRSANKVLVELTSSGMWVQMFCMILNLRSKEHLLVFLEHQNNCQYNVYIQPIVAQICLDVKR